MRVSEGTHILPPLIDWFVRMQTSGWVVEERKFCSALFPTTDFSIPRSV